MDPLYIFVFTVVASTEGFLLACILILLTQKNKKIASSFFWGALGVLLSVPLLKEFFKAPRPEGALIETTGYAFPSGHAAGALFLALSLCYLARNLRAPLRYFVYTLSLGAALAIGMSRIDLGVHTPLQVGAGYAIAVVWVALFVWLARRK